MVVLVTFIMKCDICGDMVSETRESCPYNDEMVNIPDGWETFFPVPEQYRSSPLHSICDACPECQKEPNWENYVEA